MLRNRVLTEVGMIDIERQNETASSLILAGLIACLFDVLVLFFLPSAVRQGHHLQFLVIMTVLLVVGSALMVCGFVMRRKCAKF